MEKPHLETCLAWPSSVWAPAKHWTAPESQSRESSGTGGAIAGDNSSTLVNGISAIVTSCSHRNRLKKIEKNWFSKQLNARKEVRRGLDFSFHDSSSLPRGDFPSNYIISNLFYGTTIARTRNETSVVKRCPAFNDFFQLVRFPQKHSFRLKSWWIIQS